MNKQGDIIKLHYKDKGRERSQLFVILSRNEYNFAVKKVVACPIISNNTEKPFLVPVNQEGLRGGSKVNTLDVFVFKNMELEESKYERVGSISNKEFIQMAQKFAMNFNFPF